MSAVRRVALVALREATRTRRLRYASLTARRTALGETVAPFSRLYCTSAVPTWPEHEFQRVAEASLEAISEQVSELGYGAVNAPDDFDIELSQGVLTIALGDSGTYVLNTQTPNRQIWMSSPKSGPWRYEWRGEWRSTRDGHRLVKRLEEELGGVFGEVVTIRVEVE